MKSRYMQERESARPAPHKTIAVKAGHIAHADRNKSRTCAIAAALSDAGAVRPIVHRGKVSFTINGERFSYLVPPTMALFITMFDKHGAAGVRPTTMRLRDGIVRKAVRTGGLVDRTQHTRHQPGGRAARPGYKGKRTVVLTNTRLDGFAVPKTS